MKRHALKAVVAAGLIWCTPAAADCLARPVKDANNVERNYSVVVPSSEIAEYRAKGYAPTSCQAVDAAALQKRACEVAQIKSRGVQFRIEQVLGVSAAKICASAKLARGAAVNSDNQ